LTPILLVLLAGIFAASLVKPIGVLAAPIGDYARFPLLKGFLDGYLTMDAIAALNFGIVISWCFDGNGSNRTKENSCQTRSKAGITAGVLLAIIYGHAVPYLGAVSLTRFGITDKWGPDTYKCRVVLIRRKGSYFAGG